MAHDSDWENESEQEEGAEVSEQSEEEEESGVEDEGSVQEEEQGEEDNEDAVQQEERRQQNIQALISGRGLTLTRKPLLPRLLSVKDAEAILRQPFRSPHPNAATGPSEALRRKLLARRQFVPWGANSTFVPLKLSAQKPQPPLPEQSQQEAAPAKVELPPGIEPLVLWEPPPGSEAEGGDGGAVRVDDMLTRWLRPHQREGVQFMFECVCGLRSFEGQGCILADDMGLGKTLQGITLLWTLLNSGHEALGGLPVARRVVICCPTSLVSNWDSECNKWLQGRVRTLPLCESTRDDVISSITQFLSPRNYFQVLIVSYETFRLHGERFKGEGCCDLLICDEAHRLKNDQTLTNKALGSLACKRRVLLSGTPLQNHLDEFYAMVSFCNPGVLGSPSQFRKRFELPILAGREPGATEEQVQLGAERSAELSAIVNEFILRRTNSLLSAHLPPKVIEVVCCRMTPLQTELYCHFLQSKATRSLFSAQKAARVLSAITSLRKLLNHPKLIYDALHSNAHPEEGAVTGFEDCAKFFPPGMFDAGRAGRGGMMIGWELLSGKFAVVARMLEALRPTKERVVIVSNFTQTLDLFAQLCREKHYPFVRLDGSTTINKRQKLVKKFNDPAENQFVFLLSSKAGGCGLNLVGGNRLVLFDPSWNPADDKQAAGRVWRDGQKRRVFVYRFLATGTIEEKVYQRQLSKEGLQQVVNSKGGAGAGPNLMSMEELRDLFSYDPSTPSNTYESMCRGDAQQQQQQQMEAAAQGGGGAAARTVIFKPQCGKPAEDDLQNWGHHSTAATVPDTLMQQVGGEDVSFVFSCQVEGKPLESEQLSQGYKGAQQQLQQQASGGGGMATPAAAGPRAAAAARGGGGVSGCSRLQPQPQQAKQQPQPASGPVAPAVQSSSGAGSSRQPLSAVQQRMPAIPAHAPAKSPQLPALAPAAVVAVPGAAARQQPGRSMRAAAEQQAAAAAAQQQQQQHATVPIRCHQPPGQAPATTPAAIAAAAAAAAPRPSAAAAQAATGVGVPAAGGARPCSGSSAGPSCEPACAGAYRGKENRATGNAPGSTGAAACLEQGGQQGGAAAASEVARPTGRALLSLPKKCSGPSERPAPSGVAAVQQTSSGGPQKRKLAEETTAASKRVICISDSDDDFM